MKINTFSIDERSAVETYWKKNHSQKTLVITYLYIQRQKNLQNFVCTFTLCPFQFHTNNKVM